MKTKDAQELMIDAHEAFCARHNLPYICAFELQMTILPSPNQRAMLESFSELWDTVMGWQDAGEHDRAMTHAVGGLKFYK